MPQRVYELVPYLEVMLPLVVVVGATWIDLRTRRGFGLGLLALVAVALAIFLAWQFTLAIQASIHTDNLGVGFADVAYWFALAVWALALVIAALVVAIRARQHRWIPVLMVVTPLSVLGGFLAPTYLATSVPVREGAFWGMIVPPMLTVLAYSMTRIVHPTTPERVPQLTR